MYTISLKKICLCLFILYFSSLVALYFFQQSFIYKPINSLQLQAAALPANWKVVEIKTVDGLTLRAWYVPAMRDKATILYLHGNAGDISDRFDFARGLHRLGFGVFLLEYRGYANNPGKPSEIGLFYDSQAAYRWLRGQDILPRDIVFYGELLGSAVALQLGSSSESRAVILESPFYSLTAIGGALYPWLPINYLLKEKYSSFQYTKKVKQPVMIFYGLNDTFLPYSQVSDITSSFKEKQALLVLVPDQTHTEKQNDILASCVRFFLKDHNSSLNDVNLRPSSRKNH